MGEDVALLRVLEFLGDEIGSAQAHVADGEAIRLKPLAELRDLCGAAGTVRPLDGEELACKFGVPDFGEGAAEKRLVFAGHCGKKRTVIAYRRMQRQCVLPRNAKICAKK